MDRIHAIDFTKGILVVFMVIYHCLNYLDYGSVRYEYLSFLPPSFIMITGFIITQIYFPKYRVDKRGPSMRLVVRSLKILFIFIFLNIGIRIILSRSHYGTSLDLNVFFEEWFAIYLVGSPSIAFFEVLLPISYILLMSIFILRLQSATSYFISLLATIIFFVCILLENYGLSFYNLILVSSGLIGMAIGLLPLDLINGFARSWIKLSLLFVLYGSCVFTFRDTYYMQIFFTALSLLIIYAIGIRIHLKKWLPKQVIILGQYSLLSYIIQIFCLYMIFWGAAISNINKPNTVLIIITIVLLMWVTVIIVDHARIKYSIINFFYKIILT